MKSKHSRKLSARFPERIAHQHRIVTKKLGPVPADSLQAMTDYGLTNREIARYFGLSVSSVSRLKRVLHVADTTDGFGNPTPDDSQAQRRR